VSEFLPLAIYLDSNVLFSASYGLRSRFRRFWEMANVTPVTSPYAVAEVRRHIELPAQRPRFDELIARTRVVSDVNPAFVPQSVRLADKDRPILAAAIAASANYLITGDKNHFSHLYFHKVSQVYVINSPDFLEMHQERLLA
jgi:predicted nucleic acid-binding protein